MIPDRCPNPNCACKPFRPFGRGHFRSLWRRIFFRPCCRVICTYCHKTVGWETPEEARPPAAKGREARQ